MPKNLRQKLRDPKIGGSVAGGIVVLAIVIFAINSMAPPPFRDISEIWYYDLNTDEKFAVDWGELREVPPQPAPSGPLEADVGPLKAGDPAGVRLLRFACGSCGEEQFDGYLETYTPAVIAKQRSNTLGPNELRNENWVRRLEEKAWHRVDSREGMQITFAAAVKCKGKGRLMECNVND